ncbi:sigma-70 family RNA polymerase sigma factor [Zhenpiania hominis]|uniref:FliA/WhiG family RNA polymerase sigma factor n=1 Tax=Zhenpiania hominis TaxID=2763644 RepID=A0A923SPB6_9FIRM|nr:FliA/WhiG family RNA polymerase sigma factor [Zhenpiania hominis]MBC6678326.1 FliA/WhiG family RNA polymerase sigma factor [Zhenpiania hominis]
MQRQQGRQFAGKTSEELLREYKKSQSLEIKQELVIRYLDVIRGAAIRMRDVYVGFTQMDDVIHEGVLVLMNAIDKFEPEKNVKFETYISKRMRGMIIDLARKQDWVPRSARRNARTVQQTIEHLTAQMGRSPNEKEIAEAMDISVEKLREINAKTNFFSVLSLDMILDKDDENKPAAAIPSGEVSSQPEEAYLEQEFKDILTKGIQRLKEKEQMVISLYYVEELNMKQIAEVMQVSEPRISQIHSAAIRKLKEYIRNEKMSGSDRKGN